jgi:uncharacterized membrane protein (DUF4010 family)
LAGLRTFGLVGLLGGVWGLLAHELGPVLLGFAFLGLAGVVVLAHLQTVRREGDLGVTTAVAALVTFSLGGLTTLGFAVPAAASAVIVTILLGLKPVLHDWLRRISQDELAAVLKLALISVVILPVLPNRGFGPWDALNPYAIWWMVVLIAGISFVGYFAVRIAGPRRGLPLTGLLGGLASSTATTLSFSRIGRRQPNLHTLLAAGITLSAATMFPRMILEVAVVRPGLLPVVAPTLAAMTVLAYAGAWLVWRATGQSDGTGGDVALKNPFELGPALQFGLLLAGVLLLAEGARVWLGDAGIYLLSAASGLSDVDAITLSLARMTGEGLDAEVAARGIVLAAVVNTGVKAGLVAVVAGWRMGGRVAALFAAPALAGVLVLL